MQLDKKDLEQIKTIVGEIVQKSEVRLNKKIDGVETSLIKKIEGVKTSITATINREVSDLAEINRAVIEKVDTVYVLEKRITRVEHKVGIIN